MEDSSYKKLDELKELSKKQLLIILKKLRRQRPDLFSVRAEDFRTAGSPLQGRVISLAYYQKMKSLKASLYLQFLKTNAVKN